MGFQISKTQDSKSALQMLEGLQTILETWKLWGLEIMKEKHNSFLVKNHWCMKVWRWRANSEIYDSKTSYFTQSMTQNMFCSIFLMI